MIEFNSFLQHLVDKNDIENGVKEPETDIFDKLPIPDKWEDFACLCMIRGDKGLQPFIPYDYQKSLVDLIESCPSLVVGKTRQLGLSELILNYFLWKALKIPGYLAVIFSKNQSDTTQLAKRLRRTLDSLTQYCEVITNSNTDLEFKGRGRILFRNSTPNGSRGLDAVWDLLFDEAAFVDEIEEIFKAAIPCTTVLGDKAKVIILSTPNGQSGMYYDKLTQNNPEDKDVLTLCEQIKQETVEPCQLWVDKNGIGKALIHWLAHPVYKLKKETYLDDIQKKRGLSKESVEQEYNLSFTNAESIVFSSELVKAITVGQWEKSIDPEASYYLGIDTSGMGQDYFVGAVLKSKDNKYSLVEMYRKQKDSNEAHLFHLSQLIEKYNPVKIGIEVNSGGQFYYERLRSEHPEKNIEAIKTTAQSKPTMINLLMLAMEQSVLILPKDKIVLKELFSFRNNDGIYGAISGEHDDLIMAITFALAVSRFAKG
jgi:phage terminase large subunit-like protein